MAKKAAPKVAPILTERQDSLSHKRIEIAKQGPWKFAQVYLPHLLVAQDDVYDKDPKQFDDAKIIVEAGTSVDASAFHHMLYEVADTPAPTKAREGIVAPRGFAKSTAITIVVLYWAAFMFRKFVLWTSETASQVEELVAAVIDEIEFNEALLQDFPHMAAKRDPNGNYVKFTDRDMVLESGFRLSARGTRKATRGLKRGANRPDAVICDDAEGEDSVGSGYKKTRHWLTRVLGPAISPRGDIYWLNTLVEWESITGAMIKAEEDWTRNWNVHHLQAEWHEDEQGRKVDVLDLSYLEPDIENDLRRGDIYTGGTDDDPRAGLTHHLLWPEYWPKERIDGFKEEFGLLAYSFELLNKPMSDALKPFKMSDMLSARIEGHRLHRDGYPLDDWINVALLKYITFIDPAFGGKDYAAVVTVGIFGQDTFCVEAWWYRKSDVRTLMVTEAVRQAEKYDSVAIGVENVAAQIMVADETVQNTNRPVIPEGTGNKSKLDRAQPTSIRCQQGHTYFVMDGPGVPGLRHLLSRFPGPDPDDPIDAYVYAVELAHKQRSKALIEA